MFHFQRPINDWRAAVKYQNESLPLFADSTGAKIAATEDAGSRNEL